MDMQHKGGSRSADRLFLAMTLALALAVAACGGSGGGSSARDPLPELSQDILPSGERIDLRDRNYFQAAPGDTWTHEQIDQGGALIGGSVTRSVAAGSGGDVVVSEQGPGYTDSEVQRHTAEGVLVVDPMAELGLPSLASRLPTLLMYPEPFYPVGAERAVIRQGSLGADIDGDGRHDSYRLEFRQTLVGFESVTLPKATLEQAAHFRNVLRVTVQPSAPELSSETVVATEDVWYGPGIGLIRYQGTLNDPETGAPQGPFFGYLLQSGRVAGQDLFVPRPDGDVLRIALTHQDLVYDAARARYYASLPAAAGSNGNRIAVVDAASGHLSYSGVIGSEPAALALSGDASALYVGLDGSGEVVKLRLPDLVELGRTRLPVSSSYGQRLAETITVSPLDPDVVAVAMKHVGVSPRHAGVALIRAGVVQPRMTQEHTGSNLVAFGADGSFVYGFNNESTEQGLRRIAVLADGLTEEAVVPGGDLGWSLRAMDIGTPGLVVGRAVHAVPGLQPLARIDAEGACRWHAGAALIVCLDTLVPGERARLVVAQPGSWTVRSRPAFQTTQQADQVFMLVPGPRGQVAISLMETGNGLRQQAIWLFTSPALQ